MLDSAPINSELYILCGIPPHCHTRDSPPSPSPSLKVVISNQDSSAVPPTSIPDSIILNHSVHLSFLFNPPIFLICQYTDHSVHIHLSFSSTPHPPKNLYQCQYNFEPQCTLLFPAPPETLLSTTVHTGLQRGLHPSLIAILPILWRGRRRRLQSTRHGHLGWVACI